MRLVQKIQKRYIAILFSLNNEHKRYDLKVKNPVPSTNTLVDHSAHMIVVSNGTAHCACCRQSYDMKHIGVRDWIQGVCLPILDDDTVTPAQVPPWQVKKVGKLASHVSHQLFTFKGLLFCNKCGYCAATFTRKLHDECVGFALLYGSRNLKSLWNGVIPGNFEVPVHTSSTKIWENMKEPPPKTITPLPPRVWSLIKKAPDNNAVSDYVADQDGVSPVSLPSNIQPEPTIPQKSWFELYGHDLAGAAAKTAAAAAAAAAAAIVADTTAAEDAAPQNQASASSPSSVQSVPMHSVVNPVIKCRYNPLDDEDGSIGEDSGDDNRY